MLSDKAYRSARNEKFEAVGNVIITYGPDSLYGERAVVDFESGSATVTGNVRYVGSDMTMYGTKIVYDFKTRGIKVQNARVLSDNYTVLGKQLARTSPTTIEGIDAEYTTCRDCPESWSVLGGEVNITLGEYIRIKHAYIKVRGVIVMYVPYIILPIKKDRETGLLFPSLSLNYQNGVYFNQPFFWAINDSSDMTISPTMYGERGLGSELQYRYAYSDKTFLEINSLGARDRIWAPGKQEFKDDGDRYFRLFGEYEHHYMRSNDFSHHLTIDGMGDLDIVRDYDRYTNDRINSSSSGISGFFEMRKDFFTLSTESHFRRNLMYDNPKGFDHRFVQMLPKISLNSAPIELFSSDIPLFKRLLFTASGDYTIFKQNHTEELSYIRNARRVNLAPRLDWYLGQLGVVNLQTSAMYDYQGYAFPSDDSHFRKSVVLVESEASVEIEKVFGVSYREEVPVQEIDFEKSGESIKAEEVLKERNEKIIGNIPVVNKSFSDDTVKVVHNSYKHSQKIALKHYQLADKGHSGNDRFLTQIQKPNGIGQFDSLDSLREEEFLKASSSRTNLPLSNTIELKWENSLIRKSPKKFNAYQNDRYLRDNFGYSRIAYFNLSQGYDLNLQDVETKDRLTRLHLNAGASFGSLGVSASEYYFHQGQEHIFSFNISHSIRSFYYSLGVTYDSFARPINKTANSNIVFSPIDLIQLRLKYEYDLEDRKVKKSQYGLLYSPSNNCWKFDLSYETDQIDKNISFNFLFNFNEGNFTGVTQ